MLLPRLLLGRAAGARELRSPPLVVAMQAGLCELERAPTATTPEAPRRALGPRVPLDFPCSDLQE